MGTSAENKEFVLAEFGQTYEHLRHYQGALHQILGFYTTLYLAVWGGFLATKNTAAIAGLSNSILVIGLLVGLLCTAMLLSNRFYCVIMLRRHDFLQRHFLFDESTGWGRYPRFYTKRVGDEKFPEEDHRILRPTSTFTLAVLLAAVGNAALFDRIAFSGCLGWFNDICPVPTILFFMLWMGGVLLYGRHLEGRVEKSDDIK